MDDLDAILDDVDIVPAAPAPAEADLDALLDDALDQLDLAPSAQQTQQSGVQAEPEDDLDLAIVSDYDKCLRLLGQRAQTWRHWLVDDTPIKVASFQNTQSVLDNCADVVM